MAKGKTESGFEFSVNPAKIKDVRFLRAYKQMVRSNDGTDLVELVPMILGEKQTDKLFTHCEKDGISSLEDVGAEFSEIIQILAKDNETKN